MNLFFAGCARNCQDSVVENVNALLALGNYAWCSDLRIYIVENNSEDHTRSLIKQLAIQDSRIVPILLGDLDSDIPHRESRLAYCRDQALLRILDSHVSGFYIPIDLDSCFAQSLQPAALKDACLLVSENRYDAVFPSSYPYYYDIHALREATWCPTSCWKQVLQSNAKGKFLALLADVRYISSRQRSHSWIHRQGLIDVQSAFGGVGIYSLAKVRSACSRYYFQDLYQDAVGLCEHVVFNSYFSKLVVSPNLVVSAPREYIAFRLLPFYLQVWAFLRAFLMDASYLLRYFMRLSAKAWSN